MKNTFYKISSPSFKRNVRFALVSDLHAQDYHNALELVKEANPDYILFGGDIFEALDGSFAQKNEKVFPFFYEAAKIAPSFYCTGNHEDHATHSEFKGLKIFRGMGRHYTDDALKKIEDSGVKLLLDEYVIVDGIAFGGLASGLIRDNGEPDVEFLQRFANLREPKVLICHHPEYYRKYIKKLPIDLTVSGHAHGGQWRIFGRGIYAPGQGLFPKYTSGVYDGRLVVSKGLKKTTIPPRIFNPLEVVIIDIENKI
ncbi:MAG: hypothetical protein E7678_05910 [Ruminococcaceae bacterium]|nr:hypothetical protein [Oscillospiraceae bacterium]